MPVAILRERGGPRSEGKKNVDGLEDLEARGQNADDGVGARVEIDGLAEDFRGATEAPLPKAVTEKNDGCAAGAILFGEERAADLGVDAEHGEKAGGGHLDVQAFGFAGAGESDSAGTDGLHAFERGGLVAPVAEVFVGGADHGERAFFGDQNEAGWVAKRKRAEEHAVYDAEDGGVRADAESERENGDRREARALCEEPEGEANVLHQSEHGFPSRCDRIYLIHQTDAIGNRYRRATELARPRAQVTSLALTR